MQFWKSFWMSWEGRLQMSSTGQGWGYRACKCQDSVFRYFFHPPFPQAFSAQVRTLHGPFPLHHTQAALTHHPQDRPQTGCAMSHCPVIKKEGHLRLGPALPLFPFLQLPGKFSIFLHRS